MRSVLLSTFALALSAKRFELPFLDQDFIEGIRAATSQWVPHSLESNPLRKLTRAQLLGLCGTVIPDESDSDTDADDHNRLLQ